MAWFRKLKAGLVKSEITEFVGEQGSLFFNYDTGEFRLSDGVTPHGSPIPTIYISSLRGVGDIDFTGIGDGEVLQYNEDQNNFNFTPVGGLIPKYTKYIEGLSYTIPQAEHGISRPSTITVLNNGIEVSVEAHIVNGDVTVYSNILLDGHVITIA